MAEVLADLLAARDRLLKQRGNPHHSVSSAGGHSVTYKGDADIERALNDIERRIAAAQGRRVGVVYLQTSKGV
jgi:diaminopimelate decarboxylase